MEKQGRQVFKGGRGSSVLSLEGREAEECDGNCADPSYEHGSYGVYRGTVFVKDCDRGYRGNVCLCDTAGVFLFEAALLAESKEGLQHENQYVYLLGDRSGDLHGSLQRHSGGYFLDPVRQKGENRRKKRKKREM